MSVIVLGSLNMDLVVQAARIPLPGETLLGHQFTTVPGGKGANQAVAIARQDVPTYLVGRVGADDFGHQLRHTLAVDGVNIDAVRVDADVRTGIAAITVAASGDNQIVIVPGANGQVDDLDIQQLETRLPAAQYLLLQLEIPLSTVVKAARIAHTQGLTVILDPAPVQPLVASELYPYVDILTPNQVEAEQLVGFAVQTVDDAARAIAVLQHQGVSTVIVTLGADGVLCGTEQDVFHVPAFAVPVVDTVAAGDAFNGGLAVALAEGKSLSEAVTWASATAALSVGTPGAQPSLPRRAQVQSFLAQP
jgi:ribokinase